MIFFMPFAEKKGNKYKYFLQLKKLCFRKFITEKIYHKQHIHVKMRYRSQFYFVINWSNHAKKRLQDWRIILIDYLLVCHAKEINRWSSCSLESSDKGRNHQEARLYVVTLMSSLSRRVDEWKIKSRISQGEGDFGGSASGAEILADLFVLASRSDAFRRPEVTINSTQINRASPRALIIDFELRCTRNLIIFFILLNYNYVHWHRIM